MTAGQRLAAARAFWQDEQAADDQIQAVLLIAQHKKFRPKTVVALEPERKAHHLASLPTLPDALGITHENGLIQEDKVAPDPVKVGPAAAQIAGRFPPADVSLYLNTLLYQDPETWGTLRGVPELQV